MKIQIRSRQIDVDDSVQTHIERRLRYGLGRFAPRIARATVQVIDTNGPRGGVDKICRIEVRLLPTGSVVVEGKDDDLFVAVDYAVDRITKAVSRKIERTRDNDRSTVPPDSQQVESALSKREDMA